MMMMSGRKYVFLAVFTHPISFEALAKGGGFHGALDMKVGVKNLSPWAIR